MAVALQRASDVLLDSMKITQLRTLVAVAECGSLRGAARRLGTTQPALTRYVHELERELDVELFERMGAGMILTRAGAAVLRRAVSIEAEMVRIRDEIALFRGEANGTLSVGLSTVSHLALLPRVLPSFRRRFPNVRLRIAEGLFPAMEQDVRDGLLDFYVGPLGGNRSPVRIHVEPLFLNRRLIFARGDNPLAGARSLADLGDARWVTGALTLVSEDELSPIFRDLGLPAPVVMVEGRTSLTMIAAAASSDLLTMLPRQWKTPLEATGLLHEIPVVEPLEAPTICIAHRATMPLTPAAEHLRDLFRRAAINYARTTTDLTALTA